MKLISNEMKEYLYFCWDFLQPGKIEQYQKTIGLLVDDENCQRTLNDLKNMRNTLYGTAIFTSIAALGILLSIPGSFLGCLLGIATFNIVALLFEERIATIYRRNDFYWAVFQGVNKGVNAASRLVNWIRM